MSDDDLKKLIGTPMSKARVVIERSPVANFATAVCDGNPVYRDPTSAKAAGFDAIPARRPLFLSSCRRGGSFPRCSRPTSPRGTPWVR